VRAANATGTSAPSGPVTLTFPGGCTGAPQPPLNFAASVASNVLSLGWDPPSAGAAVTSFVLDVSGTVSLSLPMATRSIVAAAPPGTYTFRVRSTNPCGQSADSPPQTVTVP
jgi:hypothetical protein